MQNLNNLELSLDNDPVGMYDSNNVHSPYFYIIQHKESGKRYAGIRISPNAKPSELLTKYGYKTSSKIVKEIISKEGLDSFAILEIILFNNVKHCRKHELNFLRDNDCRNSDNWLNSIHTKNKNMGHLTIKPPNTLVDIKKTYNILNLPSYEYLHECFEYNKETGILTWTNRPRMHFESNKEYKRWNSRHAGLSLQGNGEKYIRVSINSQRHMAHRIIWKMMYNQEPNQLIDHINENKKDNRLENLREASVFDNNRNCTRNTISNVGFMGVSKDKGATRFRARALLYGVKYNLGCYDTAEEAHEVYLKFIKEHHGEFANDGNGCLILND